MTWLCGGLASRPWQELRGQIYLGSEEFVEERSAKNLESKEIPRAQLHAAKPLELENLLKW